MLLFHVHEAYLSMFAMFCPTKQLCMPHERYKITAELEKNLSKRQIAIGDNASHW
jgi:hypothetical protein